MTLSPNRAALTICDSTSIFSKSFIIVFLQVSIRGSQSTKLHLKISYLVKQPTSIYKDTELLMCAFLYI